MTQEQKRAENIVKLCEDFIQNYQKIEQEYKDGYKIYNQMSIPNSGVDNSGDTEKTEKELKTFNCYTRLIQKKDGTTFTKLTTKYEGKYCDVLIGKDVVAPDTTKSWTIKTDDFKFLNGEYGKIWINNILEYSELEEN